MRAARFAMSGRVGWLAALAVLVASLVFIGEAAAAPPVYGIATGKQCAGPLNVGDAYVCVASISNTNSTLAGDGDDQCGRRTRSSTPTARRPGRRRRS